MIQIATLLPAISAGPARPTLLAAQSGASNFALALGSLLVPGAGPEPLPGETVPIGAPIAERQISAEPGKQLPEIGRDSADEDEAPEQNCEAGDDAPAGEDLPFAWFASGPVPAPAPAPVAPPAIVPMATVLSAPRAEAALPEAVLPEAVLSGTALPEAALPKTASPEAALSKPALPDALVPGHPKPVETAPRAANRTAAPVEAAPPAVPPAAAPVISGNAPQSAPLSLPQPAPLSRQRVVPGEAAPAAPGDASRVIPLPLRRAVQGVATPPAGEAPVALPLPRAMQGETPPVISVSGNPPKVASLPPRRAERPLAVMPRLGAVELPEAPSAVAAPPSSAPARVAAPAPLVSILAQAPAPLGVVPAPAPAPVLAAPLSPPPLAPAAVAVVPEPAPRVDAPAAEPARTALPPVAETPAPAPGAAPRAQAPDPASQPVRPPSTESVRPLAVASLIAASSVQSAPAPIAFASLRRAIGESDRPGLTNIAPPAAAIPQSVAAAPEAQQGALDMRRHEWTGKMVEMIEAMRDAAPVKESRISLMPDALGKVDIAVRQEGDRVHVHFTAETQAARQILTDAQPRLTELAEARGIRLGQTSVDMGQGGTAQGGAGTQSGQRHNETQRAQAPSAPARARATEDFTQTDERVA